MKLSPWVKIVFAGPLLLLRVAEMAASSWLVVAHRSRRFVKASGQPNSRDKREAMLMLQEKVEGGGEAAAAGLKFLGAALHNEIRRNTSILNYSKSSLRALCASGSGMELITRVFIIAIRLTFILIKQPIRIWLFMIDLISNATAPLHRRVISNAVRLANEK